MKNLKLNLSLIYSTIFILLLVSSTTLTNQFSVKTTFGIENQTSVNINKFDGKYVSIIQTIRSLLEQVSTMYQSGNYQKANQLATTAYLDNYEYLEAPLEKKGYGDLMKEIELLMRGNLRDAIEEKVPQEQLDRLLMK